MSSGESNDGYGEVVIRLNSICNSSNSNSSSSSSSSSSSRERKRERGHR